MALITFDWPDPTSPDNSDGGTELTLALQFSASAPCTCTGVRFWVPPTRPTGPSPAYVSLWTADGSGSVAILAYAEYDWSTVSPLGSWFDVAFDGVDPTLATDGGPPVALTPGALYAVEYRTFEKWGGTPAYSWPVSEGILTAPADNGWLRVGLPYGDVNLESPGATNYSVSPIIDTGEAPQGAADLTVTVAGTPTARTVARATASLPVAVDLAATGRAVARAGASLPVAATLAATARRVLRATAALSASFTLSATPTGQRPIGGTLTPGSSPAATLTARTVSPSGLIAT